MAPPPDDNLNLRFANGIVAIAEDKIITVDDVRREITPLIPQLQREAQSEQEFNQKLEALQDNAIQNLIDRVLIIKDFQKDDKRHVPDSFVDNQIADQLTRPVRQRPLEVPRLPAGPRNHHARLPQGGGGGHHLQLHDCTSSTSRRAS